MSEYVNLNRVCDLYLNHKVSATTFSTITSPMAGRLLSERGIIAGKIMEIADTTKSEQELIERVALESVNW